MRGRADARDVERVDYATGTTSIPSITIREERQYLAEDNSGLTS